MGENGNLAGNAKIPHQLQYQTLVLAVVSGRSENRLSEKKRNFIAASHATQLMTYRIDSACS